ncbi:hypothetical protein BH10CYA1_BH10CYA1_61670 [soil metagenome]
MSHLRVLLNASPYFTAAFLEHVRVTCKENLSQYMIRAEIATNSMFTLRERRHFSPCIQTINRGCFSNLYV